MTGPHSPMEPAENGWLNENENDNEKPMDDRAQMKEQLMPQAERQVKARLALEKIVELEGITASDDEIEAEYESMAKAYNMSADEIKKFVEADAVKADICVKKAVDFVKENADITTK